MPLVSIIIPSYNSSRWLGATLESALAQTHRTREIIVIDDGSTDDSLALARSFAPRGVRVYAQPNSGAASARNHGLAVARGTYIQFLDADDLLAPDKISIQLARLADAPAGSVASASWTRFYDKISDAVFETQPVWRDLSGLDFLCAHYDDYWMMPPIAWLSPRSLLDEAGPWRNDISLNDDGEYFCRVLLRSAGIVFCPEARCYYRSGLPGSLSRRADAPALQSLVRSIEANTTAMLAHEDSPRVRQSVANAWQRLAYDIYPVLLSEADAAARRARSFGGSSRGIQGGRLVRWTERIFGWRAAARVKYRSAKI
jgi:glycosyltransferase involved in cell wall biosynthesis